MERQTERNWHPATAGKKVAQAATAITKKSRLTATATAKGALQKLQPAKKRASAQHQQKAPWSNKDQKEAAPQQRQQSGGHGASGSRMQATEP